MVARPVLKVTLPLKLLADSVKMMEPPALAVRETAPVPAMIDVPAN